MNKVVKLDNYRGKLKKAPKLSLTDPRALRHLCHCIDLMEKALQKHDEMNMYGAWNELLRSRSRIDAIKWEPMI